MTWPALLRSSVWFGIPNERLTNMKDSKIEWTTHTFNGCKLLPQLLSSLELSNISDAFRLKMLQLMTGVTKRYPVIDIKSQIRIRAKTLNMVRSQVASLGVSALPAGVVVARKHGFTPLLVFWLPSVIQVPLSFAMRECVMRFSTRSSFTDDLTNPLFGLFCVLDARSVRSPALSGFAHLATRLFAHFLAFHWWDECFPALNPSFTDLSFRFFSVLHSSPEGHTFNLCLKGGI